MGFFSGALGAVNQKMLDWTSHKIVSFTKIILNFMGGGSD